MVEWKKDIIKLLPCDAGSAWLKDASDDPTVAWQECSRCDWMLWLAAQRVPRSRLVHTACQCARIALPLVAIGEARPLKAIEAAEKWCTGDVYRVDVLDAINAAYVAKSLADTLGYYAAQAAYSASLCTIETGAEVAHLASRVGHYTDLAVAVLGYSPGEPLHQCADVVRKHICVSDILPTTSRD